MRAGAPRRRGQLGPGHLLVQQRRVGARQHLAGRVGDQHDRGAAWSAAAGSRRPAASRRCGHRRARADRATWRPGSRPARAPGGPGRAGTAGGSARPRPPTRRPARRRSRSAGRARAGRPGTATTAYARPSFSWSRPLHCGPAPRRRACVHKDHNDLQFQIQTTPVRRDEDGGIPGVAQWPRRRNDDASNESRCPRPWWPLPRCCSPAAAPPPTARSRAVPSRRPPVRSPACASWSPTPPAAATTPPPVRWPR